MKTVVKFLHTSLIIIGCLTLFFLAKSYFSSSLSVSQSIPSRETSISSSKMVAPNFSNTTSITGSSVEQAQDMVVNSSDNPAFAQDSRMVIKNASLSLTVKNVEETTEAVNQITLENKGYVASASTRIIDQKEGSKVSSITIKVPAAEFDAVVDKIKSLAIKVINENITGQDITEEYVDLTGKVKNLEATRDQLYTVMKQAVKIPDILEVQRELTNVTGQIESIRGRMQYLEKSSSLGSINISLATEEKELPVVEQGWDPLKTVKNAFRSLISVTQKVVDLGLWLAIFFGPLLILGLLVKLVLKKLRKNKS